MKNELIFELPPERYITSDLDDESVKSGRHPRYLENILHDTHPIHKHEFRLSLAIISHLLNEESV